MIEFRLNQFKAIGKWLRKNLPGPLSFIAQGWLYALETAFIEAKIQSSLEKAIAPHRPSEPSLRPPTYKSTPSEVEGLDIISYESTRTRPDDKE